MWDGAHLRGGLAKGGDIADLFFWNEPQLSPLSRSPE